MANGGIFDLIAASGPSAEHRDNLMLFGRLVGSWDVTSTRFGPLGEATRSRGQWHFSWILDGLGVQDVLLVSGAEAGVSGTTLRCYDPAIDVWHVTWTHPAAGEFYHLEARQEQGRIVLDGLDIRNGRPVRCAFEDVTGHGFLWRGEALAEDGATWTLQREIAARRAAG